MFCVSQLLIKGKLIEGNVVFNLDEFMLLQKHKHSKSWVCSYKLQLVGQTFLTRLYQIQSLKSRDTNQGIYSHSWVSVSHWRKVPDQGFQFSVHVQKHVRGIVRVCVCVLPLKKSEWTAFSLAARSISRPLLPPACEHAPVQQVMWHKATRTNKRTTKADIVMIFSIN